MPWLAWHREHIRDEATEHAADRYYNCTNCLREVSVLTRRDWWCGYLPQRTWIEGKPRVPDGAPEDGIPTICPGYSTTLPEVLETARALSWRRDGLLREFFGETSIPDIARTWMDILDAQIREVERHAFRAAKRPRKGR